MDCASTRALRRPSTLRTAKKLVRRITALLACFRYDILKYLSLPSDIGFANIRGRVFPMVGMGSGVEIEANFGADLETVPFKHPEGKDREYTMTNFIE